MSPGVSQWSAADAAALLSEPEPHSHKYSRGVLGLRTGSVAYPGAAVLGAEAAWRTGVGLVRYTPPHEDRLPAFGLPSPAAAILAARPETVFAGDAQADRARCDAWVIGSGTDPARRSFAEREALRALLAAETPLVIDAGALGLAAESPPHAPAILTPHRGEFEALWGAVRLGALPGEPAEAAAILARALNVTVLLKGSLTIAASPGGTPIVYGPATPWLATAGTGDVLAGILGSLIATRASDIHEDPELLAKLGATAAALHDTAAREASSEYDDGGGIAPAPIVALDVARAVPAAWRRLRLALH